ncbi:hypothetical protein ACHQM5_016251 [Ranunculus cassubicifolius]
MLPFQNYYGFGNSTRDGLYPHRLGSMDVFNGGGSTTFISNSSSAEKKSTSASKSHSEAEKRRRERINGHLQTLRTLLPNTIKSDKASLLAEVVLQVRELKKLAADVAGEGSTCSNDSSNEWPFFPGESDELIMSYCDSEEPTTTTTTSRIKVSLSCEDRVDLVKDLSHAVKSVRGRVVKAEMSTIGGRTKSELVIERRGGGGGGGGGEEYLGMLRRALKLVVDKPGVSGMSQVLLGNKRQRLSQQLCQS